MPVAIHASEFDLLAVQAAFGDCFVLAYGPPTARRCLLVDGGPPGTYAPHLRPLLVRLAQAGVAIDAVVLSHIDNDHVTGLLELFDELAGGGASRADLPAVGGLWHNAFGLSAGGDDLAPRIRASLAATQDVAGGSHAMTRLLRGFPEGDALRQRAVNAGIPINAPFGGGHVLLEDAPPLQLGLALVSVVGPSRRILQRLRRRWLVWLRTRSVAPKPDSSLPNLSSIVLLAQLGERSVLLTGDARGDQVLAGLGERGLLSDAGTLHVSVLKVPHHGSARNNSRAFLRSLTADTYVVSADGRYGNPDLECLLDIVETAHAQGRAIELAVTNETDATRELLRRRPPDGWGYRLRSMPPGDGSMLVPIGQPSP